VTLGRWRSAFRESRTSVDERQQTARREYAAEDLTS
jgi:hypothetical protein